MIESNHTIQRYEAWAFGDMSPRHVATKGTKEAIKEAVNSWFNHYNVPHDERRTKYIIKIRPTTETYGDFEVLEW